MFYDNKWVCREKKFYNKVYPEVEKVGNPWSVLLVEYRLPIAGYYWCHQPCMGKIIDYTVLIGKPAKEYTRKTSRRS
jgi:hypothetical protein